MRYLAALLVVSAVLMTGCANVEVYTFKKARVDQVEEGNKGYLIGTAPASDNADRDPNRTLIGIDIDMGSSTSAGSSSSSSKGTSETIKTKSSQGTVTTVVEEEYIK